ncbi:ATP-binding protein [Streptomyces sp. TRM 70351]|uniref:ATP-binding protein n=1 Tax=Streptomyces sp. TRM 70351 TaxID=3116552 RepID=UPI002E7C0C5B|nr:ATP-binding protein [Streptomyces sp. TRM 70351]MEE1927553.1 ATP-binding protein [Streptomyces sp. TRM 70351]
MRHLTARLRLVEQRVRRAVAARRSTDPQPDDPLRGLYLTAEAVDRVLAAPPAGPAAGGADGAPADTDAWARAETEAAARAEAEADEAEADGAHLPLRVLIRNFQLSGLDVGLLLAALLPDADSRFERLYGYLNDDVTRRRASAGLALELVGAGPLHAAARARLAPGSPLVGQGLLLVEDTDRPFLTRSLRVPDRVTAHLLGDGTADARLDGLLTPLGAHPPAFPGGPPQAAAPGRAAGPPSWQAEGLGNALRAGVRLVYVREQPGGSASALAAAALAAAGRPALGLDLTALAAAAEPGTLLRVLAREARLLGAGVVAAPVDALTGRDGAGTPERLLRALAALPVPVLLTGRCGWDPQWAGDSPLQLTAPQLAVLERGALWREALDGAATAPGVDPDAALAPFVLSPDQVRRAARAARRQALLETAGPVAEHHLRAGVRAQNAAGLERLARRVEPAVGWDDLVLPGHTTAQLGELALRARHRDRVLGQWRMRPGGGRGRGVMALFAGDSGTGKTMSAEVVAADLGLDLYVVDLSSVVDKYVGETEKNLERIFTEAAGVNGVLLFDEADAVFGKRSEVSDARDRYANMESAYLLQRMESFDGIAVLTTNLRANLDEAFTRRLDVIVDFPVPDAVQRRALWDRCLGPAVPRGAGLDLDFCARFELAGGSIRACAVTAAYLAAEAGRALCTGDLVTAVQREYRKLGRLVLASEFAPYPTGPQAG